MAEIKSDKIVITQGDRMNPLWGKMMDLWQQRLDELRKLNDRPQSEENTATLRGRIAEIKALIALNEEIPILE